MRTLLRRLCSLHDREDPGSADRSGERVFRRVRERFRLIIGDIAHAEELEDLEQKLAVVAEGDRTVVRVALLNEDVAVEAAHLRDGEDADAAEAARMYRQNLALGNVASQHAVRVALEAIERNIACRNVCCLLYTSPSPRDCS